jgi:hypothetical protein
MDKLMKVENQVSPPKRSGVGKAHIHAYKYMAYDEPFFHIWGGIKNL